MFGARNPLVTKLCSILTGICIGFTLWNLIGPAGTTLFLVVLVIIGVAWQQIEQIYKRLRRNQRRQMRPTPRPRRRTTR